MASSDHQPDPELVGTDASISTTSSVYMADAEEVDSQEEAYLQKKRLTLKLKRRIRLTRMMRSTRNHALVSTRRLGKTEFWADSACDRGVSGPEAHKEYQEVLANKYGLKPIREEVRENFVFGDGETTTSLYRNVYPVALGGNFVGELRQAYGEVPCPLLLSKSVMTAWKCKLDFGKSETDVAQFNHTEPFNDGKTPVLDLAQFGSADTFDREKSGVPKKFWIDAARL